MQVPNHLSFFSAVSSLLAVMYMQHQYITIPPINSNEHTRNTSRILGWLICPLQLFFHQPVVQPKPTHAAHSMGSETDTNFDGRQPWFYARGRRHIVFTPALPFLSVCTKKQFSTRCLQDAKTIDSIRAFLCFFSVPYPCMIEFSTALLVATHPSMAMGSVIRPSQLGDSIPLEWLCFYPP